MCNSPLAMYYRCPGNLTLTQTQTLNEPLLGRNFPIHKDCGVKLYVSEKLCNILSEAAVPKQSSTCLDTRQRCCLLVVLSEYLGSQTS